MLIIITGSSRGFGNAIAKELVARHGMINESTKLVLLSRSRTNISEIQGIYSKSNNKNQLEVEWINCDFSNEKSFSFLDNLKLLHSKAILFNNVGVLGPLDFVQNLQYQDISDAIQINLIGTMCLTSKLLASFQDCKIINTSSLAAITPFSAWAVYCSCKAALDMFHGTIAIERKDCRVLNYAPGPLDTEMQRQIREESPNGEIKNKFIQMHEQNQLVSPIDSAKVLMNLIELDEFQSGQHIDYFDVK